MVLLYLAELTHELSTELFLELLPNMELICTLMLRIADAIEITHTINECMLPDRPRSQQKV